MDANHLEIVAGLERAGCSVLDLSAVGGGAPDLAVGRARMTYLLELKAGARARYAYADEAHQRERMAAWRGGAWVKVTSLDEALRAVGAVRGERAIPRGVAGNPLDLSDLPPGSGR